MSKDSLILFSESTLTEGLNESTSYLGVSGLYKEDK